MSRMKRRAVWVMTILLPMTAACGDDQPQVTGTAHVLRVLESLESQQETVIDRLTALEESVGALEAGGRADAAPADGGATGAEVTVATTVAFTEGPTVAEDGTLYFTDLGNNRIMRLSTDGELSTFRQPSNDAPGLIFDGQGRIFFTDRPGPSPTPEQTGVHSVYRIDPDGTIERILTEPEVLRPNGIVISPDDATLYVIEIDRAEGGPRMVRAFELSPEGTAGNMRVLYDFYPGRSGDGMTIDSQGNLYVAAGLNRPRGTTETLDTVAGVHVISPAGELIRHIPIPEDTITNAAFGGPDLRTLYVTAGKTVFSVRTDIEGTRR